MMHENIQNKTFLFAIRIVNLCKLLKLQRKEFTLSKQLLRSGTSIGANISEAQHAQSRADFLAKMSIALKEANETQYWIKLLYQTDYLNHAQYSSINHDVDELISILTAICKNASK